MKRSKNFYLIILLVCLLGYAGLNHFGFIPSSGDAAGKSESVATVNGNAQEITTELGSRSYAPITVQAGIPVRWTIKADKASINGCNNAMIIPEYGVEHQFVEGDNVIEFTPTKTGTVPYSCWMGMINSKITVVDKV